MDNYQGTTLFAVSPIKDSLDVFRENFNVQLFDVNLEMFGSEFVGNRLYANGTNNVPYEVEIISKGYSENFPDFHTIEYALSDSTTNVKSKMFCMVKDKKVYSIIFTDSKITFDDNLRDVFEPVLATFRSKKRR